MKNNNTGKTYMTISTIIILGTMITLFGMMVYKNCQ